MFPDTFRDFTVGLACLKEKLKLYYFIGAKGSLLSVVQVMSGLSLLRRFSMKSYPARKVNSSFMGKLKGLHFCNLLSLFSLILSQFHIKFFLSGTNQFKLNMKFRIMFTTSEAMLNMGTITS